MNIRTDIFTLGLHGLVKGKNIRNQHRGMTEIACSVIASLARRLIFPE
jgi:hypothetical protein